MEDNNTSWVKKYWAIILGGGFIWTGISSLKEDAREAMEMTVLGAAILVGWFLWRRNQKQKQKKEIEEQKRKKQDELEQWTIAHNAHLAELKERETQEKELRAKQEEEKRQAHEKKLQEQERRRQALNECVDQVPEVPIVISGKPAGRIDTSQLEFFQEGPKFTSVTSRSNKVSLSDFVVLDVETTGLSAYRDRIVEVSAIRFRDFEPVEQFHSFVNPEDPIPERATSIHGITDEMVKDAPTFGQIADNLVSFIGKDNLVGHNLAFDLKFIVSSGADITQQKRRYYDTLAIAKSKLQRERYDGRNEFAPNTVSNFKLGTLCSHMGVMYVEAHRSQIDCLVTGSLFKKFVEMIVD